jgi:hypothetical protein
MKKSTLALLAPITLFFVSCGGGDYEWDDSYFDDYERTANLEIDNGVDTNVFVTLTGIDKDTSFEQEVGGISLASISIPYGKYKVDAVTSLDSVIIDGEEIFLDEDSYIYDYNLNLTKQDYIVENIKYTVGTDYSDLLGNNKQFTYDGQTYDGIDAYVIKGKLLVEDEWDYNLDQEAPEEVTIYGGANSTTKKKLYRANTFMLYLALYEIFGGLDDEGSEESLW